MNQMDEEESGDVQKGCPCLLLAVRGGRLGSGVTVWMKFSENNNRKLFSLIHTNDILDPAEMFFFFFFSELVR